MKFLFCISLISFLIISSSQVLKAQKQNADSIIAQRQRSLFKFLNISLQDKIADIGTRDGGNLIPIANHYPTLKFTAEDIDAKYCNKEKIAKRIKKTGNKTKIENFDIQIGTETSTNLPSDTFTKVFLFDVIHEMTYKAEMLADVRRILKTNGNIYILEILVRKKEKKDKVCTYPFLTEGELNTLLKDNKLKITKEEMFIDIERNQYVKLFECSFI